jgi:hypothetical protein
MKLSEFGRDYLLLALRINKHQIGYVDFYIGPKKLRKVVDNEEIIAPKKLLAESSVLQEKLLVQGYHKTRERYIEKNLLAMRTSIEILNGIDIPIQDQFLKFYDIHLQPVNEAELDNLKDEFSKAYRGSGSLEQHMKKLRMLRIIPGAKVFNLFNKALKIVDLRTRELFVDILPRNESVNINLIKNVNKDDLKWSYYNWYQGKYRSRIDVNPNFGMYWTTFLPAAAHEGYPGHHTEFSVKEKLFCRELNQFEHSILLLNSPKLFISESIAELAPNMLYSYQEQAEIGLNLFCPDTSKDDSLEILMKQNKVKGKLSLLWYNLAYHALIDKWSKEDLIQYATDFEVFNLDTIKNQLNKINNISHSTTIFSYNLGRNLIINNYGEFPSIKDFRNLLVKPTLPSDLV